MEAQHTKGEWKQKLLQVKCRDKVIANIDPVTGNVSEENYANAKLIAAAPELLEALKLANKIIDRLCEDYSSIANKHANFTQGESKRIESAVKKATE